MKNEKIIHEKLQVLITWKAENPESRALDFAINYAVAGLNMSGHALYGQCLYVLSNITRWRGAVAGNVRQVLRDFVGS